MPSPATSRSQNNWVRSVRIGGREGEDAEQQAGADQGHLAAVAVTDPAEYRRPEQKAEIAGAEHWSECAAFNAPRRDEMRRRERDGGDVVAVDDRNQDRPYQHPDLEAAQPAFVEQTRKLDFRFAGHRSPLAEKSLSRKAAPACVEGLGLVRTGSKRIRASAGASLRDGNRLPSSHGSSSVSQ
jgi:hypothetical protein